MSKRSYFERFHLNTKELHQKGFTILHQVFDIEPDILENLTKQVRTRGNTIFGADKKRKQCSISCRSKKVRQFKSTLNEMIHEIIISTHPNYEQGDWVILRSLENSKRQHPHHDYIPSQKLKKCPNEEFPLGVICSLMSETKLNVWIDGKEEIANLNGGDILVFRGDFTHAGSAYEKENIRLHCYIDNVMIPRTPNRTHIVNVKE